MHASTAAAPCCPNKSGLLWFLFLCSAETLVANVGWLHHRTANPERGRVMLGISILTSRCHVIVQREPLDHKVAGWPHPVILDGLHSLPMCEVYLPTHVWCTTLD
ncbi:hypothetical protein F4679DRAFT_2008 [Xylaria curta]|nr:hypothetical protein F4679DRAFT_2008 [Xylaria curta]